jgi:parallel beta-helix repeat protein
MMLALVLILAITAPAAYDIEGLKGEVLPAMENMYLSNEVHGPIFITNHSQFITQAEAEDWPGDGSEEDPYRIEYYNITTDFPGIYIMNVLLHIKIEGCYIEAVGLASPGIYTNNVTHCEIRDTTVSGFSFGLYIDQDSDVLISGCTVFNSETRGIYFQSTGDCRVENSEVYGCQTGIWGQSTNSIEIVNTDSHENIWDGIYLVGCDFVTITGGTFYDNDGAGMYIYDSQNCTIESNEVYGNQNIAAGIHLLISHNATITGNEVHDNLHDGVFLASSDFTRIQDNNVWNNTPSGISLDASTFTSIVGNEILNNTHYGVYGSVSDDTTVIYNQIYGNGWNLIPYFFNAAGIHNYWGNWWIEDNTIWNNTEYGVWSEGDDSTVIRNRIWNNNNSGIGVSECYDNLITENTVFENKRGIELATIGTNVTSNIIYDNDVGIYADYIGYMYLYDNDIGWNTINAFERSAEDQTYWHDNESQGNYWHDYSGTGSYGISNESGVGNYDLFPQKNMYVNAPTPFEFEITSTGNTMEVDAFARSPSSFRIYINSSLYDSADPWNGGTINLELDGLSAGYHQIWLIVYHVSEHASDVYTHVNVTDLTAPDWIIQPEDQEITEGDTFSYQIEAEDPSGIAGYAINETVNFAIDSSGLITALTDLAPGSYGLNVSVWDPFGNTRFALLTVTVRPAPIDIPPPIDGAVMFLLAVGGGAAFFIVVTVIYLKKRE